MWIRVQTTRKDPVHSVQCSSAEKKMTYYLWILLFGALVVIKAQELSLEDALDFGDDKATAKTEKPPKAKGGGLDLEDALGPEPEKPKTDPKLPVDTGNSGGSFSDSDLGDVAKDGGNPGASQWDSSDEPQNDQPKEQYQQWLKLLTLLGDNLPEGLLAWISNSKQVVVSLLETLMELLDLSEAEKQS